MRTNTPRGFRHSTLAMAVATALVPLPTLAATFNVTNGNDTGPGSWRQAVSDTLASCSGQSHTIAFVGGPFVVSPSGPPPVLSCIGSNFSVTIQGNGSTINGSGLSAYGSSCIVSFYSYGGGNFTIENLTVTNHVGGGTAICTTSGSAPLTLNNVTVSNSYTGVQANTNLTVTGGNYTGNSTGIYALGVTTTANISGAVISGNDYGIETHGPSTITGNTISGGYTGINAYGDIEIYGNTVTGNEEGIRVSGNVVTIGGAGANRNIVSGNQYIGIEVSYAGTVMIEGNYVGPNASGNASGGAQETGIEVEGTGVTIMNNVISGNSFAGIFMDFAAGTIIGNTIGPGVGGANLGSGAGILAAADSGMINILQNTIKLNSMSGVSVYGGPVRIAENAIYNNTPKNIDLTGIGAALTNDPGDTDIGPNGLLNHPVVTSVIHRSGGTEITYTLDTLPGSYQVQAFKNASAVAIPAGETYLAPHFVTVSAPGVVTQTFSIPGQHNFISLTTINSSSGETSEFSPVRPLDGSSTVTVSPGTSLSFPNVPIDTSSNSQTVTFTSSGSVPWTLGAFGTPFCSGPPSQTTSAAAPYAGPLCTGTEFMCSTTCVAGTAYNPGQSCSLTVTFAPTTVGTQSTSVQFCDDAVTGSPRTISISGSGIEPPALGMSPTGVDFGSVLQGTTSDSRVITISNPGASSAALGAPIVSGPFAITANDCAASLPPGGSCKVEIGFTPTAEGYYTGSFKFAGFPTVLASLVGRGIRGARLVASPSSIDFPAYVLGSPVLTRAVTLRNAGGQPFTLTSVKATGPFGVTHNCPAEPLPPEGSCTAQVTFNPTALGEANGELTVTGDQAGTSAIVPLHASAQGSASARLQLSSSNMSFGGRGIFETSPTQTVRVKNIGAATAIIDSLVASSEFLILGHNCNAPLAPLAECSANIAMRAQGFGPRNGTFAVHSNGEGSPNVVNLSGSGCRPPGFTGGRFGGRTACSP